MSFEPARFFAIRSKDVDQMTGFLLPLLERFACETCLSTPQTVLSAAKCGDAQLWSYHDGRELIGLIATEIKTGIGHKNCLVWVCVGLDVLELVEGVMNEIETWAKTQGCTAMEIVGRPGWQRFVKGYRKTAVVLEKSLVETH